MMDTKSLNPSGCIDHPNKFIWEIRFPYLTNRMSNAVKSSRRGSYCFGFPAKLYHPFRRMRYFCVLQKLSDRQGTSLGPKAPLYVSDNLALPVYLLAYCESCNV